MHAQLGPHRRAGVLGGHRRPLSRVARVLREFNPEMTLIGVDTVGSTIFGQPARPRLMRGLGSKHLSGQRGLRGVQREVHWVAPAESVGVPGVGGHPLRDGRVGVVRLLWWPGGRPANPRRGHRRGDLSGRPATVLRDRLQRRLLPPAPSARCRPATEPLTIRHPADTVVDSWTRCTTVVNPTEAVR